MDVMANPNVSIGIDIGCTFTDGVAIYDNGRLRIAKVPSTRSDPSAAVRTAPSYFALTIAIPSVGTAAAPAPCRTRAASSTS